MPDVKHEHSDKARSEDPADTVQAARDEIIERLNDDAFSAHALAEALAVRSRIDVTNRDGGTVHVRISKACGQGQDGYWEIPPGHTESWKRCVYHRVTIKASYDRVHDFDSVDHITAISTGCKKYEVNGGRLVYVGPPDCL